MAALLEVGVSENADPQGAPPSPAVAPTNLSPADSGSSSPSVVDRVAEAVSLSRPSAGNYRGAFRKSKQVGVGPPVAARQTPLASTAMGSETVRHGLVMLKCGVRAMKYGRHRCWSRFRCALAQHRPHSVLLKLSDDASEVRWSRQVRPTRALPRPPLAPTPSPPRTRRASASCAAD